MAPKIRSAFLLSDPMNNINEEELQLLLNFDVGLYENENNKMGIVLSLMSSLYLTFGIVFELKID